MERVGTGAGQDQGGWARVGGESEARHTSVDVLDDDEYGASEKGIREAREGKFASDEEIARIFDKARSPAHHFVT